MIPSALMKPFLGMSVGMNKHTFFFGLIIWSKKRLIYVYILFSSICLSGLLTGRIKILFLLPHNMEDILHFLKECREKACGKSFLLIFFLKMVCMRIRLWIIHTDTKMLSTITYELWWWSFLLQVDKGCWRIPLSSACNLLNEQTLGTYDTS